MRKRDLPGMMVTEFVATTQAQVLRDVADFIDNGRLNLDALYLGLDVDNEQSWAVAVYA
jgi:hypothetical protein